MGHENTSLGGRQGGAPDHQGDLAKRLDEHERRIERLETTLRAVAREVDEIAIDGPCQCGDSLLLVRSQEIYCPECNYRRTH